MTCDMCRSQSTVLCVRFYLPGLFAARVFYPNNNDVDLTRGTRVNRIRIICYARESDKS